MAFRFLYLVVLHLDITQLQMMAASSRLHNLDIIISICSSSTSQWKILITLSLFKQYFINRDLSEEILVLKSIYAYSTVKTSGSSYSWKNMIITYYSPNNETHRWEKLCRNNPFQSFCSPNKNLWDHVSW